MTVAGVVSSVTGRAGAVVRGAALVLGARSRVAGAVILGYHDVLSAEGGFHVSPARLRDHLRMVQDAGFTFVPLEALVSRLGERRPLDRLAVVTFDDGLLGLYDHGLAVLSDLGVPATAFVVSAGHGTAPTWWPGAQRTVSAAELVDLAGVPGLTVGSHTRTHRSLPSLDRRAMRAELAGSRHELEHLIGRPVDLLAYPSGHHDGIVRAEAAAAGYRAACTFANGRVTSATDPHRLPRLTMGVHHHRARLAVHLSRAAATWPDADGDTVGAPTPIGSEGRRTRV